MTIPQPQPDRGRNQSDDPQLRLADSDNEGSTDIVGGKNGDASGGSGSEFNADENRRLTASPPTDSAGTSTGGFETMLGKLVVQRGLVSADEIELANSLVQQSEAGDTGAPGDSQADSGDTDAGSGARTLADVLLENEFLTRRQLDRLRNEFEAKRSTKSIPGYRIKGKIGYGAMATVWLAKQLSLDRHVAIKVLPKKFSTNTKFIERFYKEGKAAAQLNHPNIVQAYDVGKAGDHHYFVMEYVDGPTVFDLLIKQKRIKEKEAIRITHDTALALKHAHERGFIHRDIKPKNIMLNKQGVVKLADLGLARALTDKETAKAEAGRAYGTPYYISPEQIRGEIKIGPQADIYGLGSTFYHMVTGRVPFEGKNPSAVMHKHLKSELKPPDHVNPEITAGTAQVIEKMMAKDVNDRYQTIDDVLEDLDLVARGEHPRYAKGALDITGIAAAVESMPESQPTVVQSDPRSFWASPVVVAALVLFGLSLVANLILITILAL